jgi:ribonuclease P protein component
LDAQSLSFPVRLRLKKPLEFKRVFTNPVKSADRFFTVLAIRNEYSYPRLGLAITKKNIKKAVTRNFIKRTVRENFRLQQHQLSSIDIVVLARKDAATATSALLKHSLDKHWLKLNYRCESYS